MKKYIIAFSLLLTVSAFSQSEPKLSLFSYNPLQYNPAYAGVFNGLSVNGLYSSQWVGFEGAPTTLFLSAHSNVFKREVGAGINVTSDKIGPVQDNQFVGNFAYHVYLNDEVNLIFGLKAGIDNFIIDYNLLSIENPEELGLIRGSISQYSPIIGAGMYVSNEKGYFGLSVPNLLETNFYNEFKNSVAKAKPNYFLSAGYKFELGDEVFVTPNILTRVTSGAPISNLFALNLDFENKILGSINMQPGASLGGFFGYRFENNIAVGYAYDNSLNKFSTNNNGCHTFYISFKLEDLFENHYGYGTF
jgi:type IX secretion system PorP/SprF family membrane protein